MKRWLLFSACLIFGAAMVLLAILLPAHLRAVDSRVVERAGRGTPTVVERGLAFVYEKNSGAAQLLLETARNEGLPDREKLAGALASLSKQGQKSEANTEPFTEFLLHQENRARALEKLEHSPRLFAAELIRCRGLKNTVIFPPSSSPSGQAFDTALSICGLLSEEGHMTPSLTYAISTLALEANRTGNSKEFEQAILDLMSIGQRLNWEQLVTFVSPIETTDTLRILAEQMRKTKSQIPALFTAVQLSGKPGVVAKYLSHFSQTGMNDLATSLRYGEGGLSEVLKQNQRLYTPKHGQNLVLPLSVDLSWRQPQWALGCKWFCFLAGGFLLAAALHFARPAVSKLEKPLQVQVRGFHIARESLFALGFLLMALLLSEPFLSEESQKMEPHFRLHLPSVGGAATSGTTSAHSSMNQNQMIQLIVTMVLFFVLQGLLYISCLVKLAEIRRQKVSAPLKLKLLENEEHLFDAGLYLGFAGTIVCLILVTLGVFKLSLMAAYSSTSFGIVFVSVFKIFHLRPFRRKLILEQENSLNESTTVSTGGKLKNFPS